MIAYVLCIMEFKLAFNDFNKVKLLQHETLIN